MNKRDLEKLGVTDEALIDQIIVLHGKGIEAQKKAAEDALAEATGLKNQLTEANTAIDGFKKLNPEGLQKAVDDYKVAAEKAKKDAADQIASIKFDHALEKELKEAKAKDPYDVIPHLKKDMLKLGEDGKFIGLTEQLEPLKISKDYLFNSDTPTPKVVLGGQSKSVLSDAMTDAIRKGAGLPPLK
jgi:dsDNA-specific endonuclease/ATPase MutS2